MKNRDFEENTRLSAMELITTVSETQGKKLLKDNQDQIKNLYFPALADIMTCLEHQDDLEEWLKIEDEDILASNDLASKAGAALGRLCEHLG